MSRYVTPEHDPRSRFGLYRLCQCIACEGRGQWQATKPPPNFGRFTKRCPDCRGEGRIRQEVASCESPEAVGVALVTLAREGEWEECPFGLLDREPECSVCEGTGGRPAYAEFGAGFPIDPACPDCKGSGVKPTGTWLLLPWLPSPRNVSDAGKLLRSSQSK